MKKFISAGLAVLMMAFALSGCSVAVESIDLPQDMEVEAGASITLTAEILPENATDISVIWSSSDETVASVDENGVLTAHAPGEATVTATTGNEVSAQMRITVIVTLQSLQVEDTYTLLVGEVEDLVVNTRPENATGVNLVYESADEGIATVDGAGKVEGVSRGETTITVSSGDIRAEIQVTVQQPVTGVTLDKTEAQLAVGHSFTLQAFLEPEDADVGLDINWSSSDDSVATVNEEGLVTAVSAGTAEITAETEDVLAASCTVTVTRPAPAGGGGNSGGGAGGQGGSGQGGTTGGGNDPGGSGAGGGDSGGGNAGGGTSPGYSLSDAVAVGISHAQSLGFTVRNYQGGWSYPAPVTPTSTSTQQQVNTWVVEMVNHVHSMVTQGGALPLYEGTEIFIYESGGAIFAAY